LHRVEAISLAEVTPARVQRWKVTFLKPKGGNPLKDRVARTSCNSILRQAKGLFSPDRLRFVTGLPPDFKSPFEGIRFEARQSMRYRSTLDLETLIRSAWNDLDEERLKAFLLAAYASLRRNEIDKLTWDAFDFQKKTITLRVSEHGAITSQHYVDKKRRTTLGLGYLLRDSWKTVPSPAQAEEAGSQSDNRPNL
jgi:integrase